MNELYYQISPYISKRSTYYEKANKDPNARKHDAKPGAHRGRG